MSSRSKSRILAILFFNGYSEQLWYSNQITLVSVRMCITNCLFATIISGKFTQNYKYVEKIVLFIQRTGFGYNFDQIYFVKKGHIRHCSRAYPFRLGARGIHLCFCCNAWAIWRFFCIWIQKSLQKKGVDDLAILYNQIIIIFRSNTLVVRNDVYIHFRTLATWFLDTEGLSIDVTVCYSCKCSYLYTLTFCNKKTSCQPLHDLIIFYIMLFLYWDVISLLNWNKLP